jgi:chaperonin GroEL
MLNGIIDIARLAATTYGPNGRTVWIDRPQGTLITKDGYMVIREAVPYGDMPRCLGGKVLLDGVERQNQEQGDGTTLTAILAGSLAQQCLLHSIPLDPYPLVRQIQSYSQPVSSESEILSLAQRAGYDLNLAQQITSLLMDLGEGAHIVVEPGWASETRTHIQTGAHWVCRSYGDKTLDEPLVAISRTGLESLADVQEMLEWVAGADRPLLLVAPWVESVAAQTIRMNPSVKVLGVRQGRIPLDDLAVLTGATIRDTFTGQTGFERDWFGHAVRATTDSKGLTILPYEDRQRDAEKLAQRLSTQADESDSPFDADRLRERAASLQSSIGFVRLGAATDLEGKEAKGRLEDLLGSLSSALRTGTVPQAAWLLKHLDADPVTQRALAKPYAVLKRSGIVPSPDLRDPTGVVTGALAQAMTIVRLVANSGAVLDSRGRPVSQLK